LEQAAQYRHKAQTQYFIPLHLLAAVLALLEVLLQIMVVMVVQVALELTAAQQEQKQLDKVSMVFRAASLLVVLQVELVQVLHLHKLQQQQAALAVMD
jgi:Na+-transporting NADH:ubiquinone oxidoreductase subunit NqrC